MAQMTHREYVDACRDETIDEPVAGEHIFYDIIIQRVPVIEESLIDVREDSLKLSEGGCNRNEIYPAHAGPTS